MILEIDSDVHCNLWDVDGDDSFRASNLNVAFLHRVQLHSINHILQGLLDKKVEEVVDCTEVQLGVEHLDVWLAVPMVFILSLRPVTGHLRLELRGQERNEVDLVVLMVAEAVE